MTDRSSILRPGWHWALVGVQLALLAAIWLIDYGWRSPGQFGLQATDQLLAMLAYIPLLIGGLAWAFRRRDGVAIAAQLLLPLAFWGWANGVGVSRDPADHQDLVGKTRNEVMEAMSDRRIGWSGERGDEQGTALVFDGLDVYLTDERRITRVVPDTLIVPSAPSLDASEHQDLVGQPYPVAFRTLVDQGGTTFGIEADSVGAYQQYNGLRLYFTGEERATRVEAP